MVGYRVFTTRFSHIGTTFIELFSKAMTQRSRSVMMGIYDEWGVRHPVTVFKVWRLATTVA